MRPSYYDDSQFDYEEYWQGREYEDRSEKIALERFFSFLGQKRVKRMSLLEVGGGFGRLAAFYLPLVKEVFLLEPSQKLAERARKRLANKGRVKIIKETIEETHLSRSFDLVIMIRVIHHLSSPEKAIKKINHLLLPGGFLILEFANKANFKSLLGNIFSWGRKSYFSLTRVDRRSAEKKKAGAIPFYNYHPRAIAALLEKNGFVIKKRLSVSNFRLPFLKRIIPLSLLLRGEKIFQPLLSPFNFGPSIFILAQKKK